MHVGINSDLYQEKYTKVFEVKNKILKRWGITYKKTYLWRRDEKNAIKLKSTEIKLRIKKVNLY